MMELKGYFRPDTATEVDQLLADERSSPKVFAGGTDLMVELRTALNDTALVDITAVKGLDAISVLPSGGLRVGAAVRLSSIRTHPTIRHSFRALAEAAATVGSHQIQNMGTLVGNACNASPAADTAPALLLYAAVMNLRSTAGSRRVPVRDFWTGPRMTSLRVGEWVESIDLSDVGHHGSAYVKLGRTRGVDLALTGAAVLVTGKDVRLAFASMAPTPVSAAAAERILSNAVLEPDWSMVAGALRQDLSPIGDIRASKHYRQEMALVTARKAFELAGERSRVLS